MIRGEVQGTMHAKFSPGRISRMFSTRRIGLPTPNSSLTICFTGKHSDAKLVHQLTNFHIVERAGEESLSQGFIQGMLLLRHSLCRCSLGNSSLDSYDYGAAIRESRALSPKFDELKRQSLFLRSSPEFRKTDWIGDTSTGIPGVTVNGSAAYVTLLKNPDTKTSFFIVRQSNSSST